MNRREFIYSAPAALFFSGFPNFALASQKKLGRMCIIILEGGLDGIAAVPPIGDRNLPKLRKDLIIENELEINPFFGLHPSLKNFANMLHMNEATIIHAVNFPYNRRSHFEGQNIVESGILKPFSSETGWLGRAMDLSEISGRALSLDTPLLVRGKQKVENFFPASMKGSRNDSQALLEALRNVYEGDLLETANILSDQIKASQLDFRARDPVGLATYAGTKMKNSIGPRVSVIRVPDFDTHANQGADKGNHAAQLTIVDDVLKALKDTLGDVWSNTIVVTLTEFGRTARQNGSGGTDHGFGSASFLAGGLLNNSRIISDWPGLKSKNLFEDRDLYATVDMRSVCAACLEASFGLEHEQIREDVFFEPKLPRLFNEIFS